MAANVRLWLPMTTCTTNLPNAGRPTGTLFSSTRLLVLALPCRDGRPNDRTTSRPTCGMMDIHRVSPAGSESYSTMPSSLRPPSFVAYCHLFLGRRLAGSRCLPCPNVGLIYVRGVRVGPRIPAGRLCLEGRAVAAAALTINLAGASYGTRDRRTSTCVFVSRSSSSYSGTWCCTRNLLLVRRAAEITVSLCLATHEAATDSLKIVSRNTQTAYALALLSIMHLWPMP